MTSPTSNSSATAPPTEPRRNFLTKTTAILIGGIVGIVPFLAGLFTVLDPLRRKSDGGQFIRITTLDAIPVDGLPRRFAVLSDRTDAWNRFKSEPIGAVYLRRPADAASGEKVEALNSTCPHAGCFVDFNAQADCFKCPCHNSTFTLTGAIIQPSPSPRPMDSLSVELRDSGGSKEVWVQFENFYTGIAEKLPKV